MEHLPSQKPRVYARKQAWPLQIGQPLTEPKYSQQQSKCNKRQIGSEPKPSDHEQMH